jgi:hypothetical protein
MSLLKWALIMLFAGFVIRGIKLEKEQEDKK